jgi:transcriptional regulator of arginine metabolism
MSRTLRHSKILEIITANEVETQEVLVAKLNDQGLKVTQATVSRDIKELGLVKVLTDKNTYKYAVINNFDSKIPQRFINVFREAVTSFTATGNLLVIKTMRSGANAVAMIIDQMALAEVVGTIAGNDTIFVAAKSERDLEILIGKLNSLM